MSQERQCLCVLEPGDFRHFGSSMLAAAYLLGRQSFQSIHVVVDDLPEAIERFDGVLVIVEDGDVRAEASIGAVFSIRVFIPQQPKRGRRHVFRGESEVLHALFPRSGRAIAIDANDDPFVARPLPPSERRAGLYGHALLDRFRQHALAVSLVLRGE